MKRKLLVLLSVLSLSILSACGISESAYNSLLSENERLKTENEELKKQLQDVGRQTDSVTTISSSEDAIANSIDENSWDYIVNNYPYVTYDEVKSGSFNEQYVILPVTLDNVEFRDYVTDDWVVCDVWYASEQSFVSDDVTFYCEDLPNYSPQSLNSGDNIDICFYIYKDGSFGSDIKGFNKNTNSISLDSVYNSFKEHCIALDYKAILRDPDGFGGQTVFFSGSVFQIIEQDDDTSEFLLFTGSNDEYIHVRYYYKDGEPRIIEDDSLTVYGTFYKLYDYTSALGTGNSVPHVSAEFIDNFSVE